MSNRTAEPYDAKERILRASVDLFSQKGFDSTSVSEIAASAEVTKALIYYYFNSKEEILDSLVKELLDNTTSLAMDFVHANIVRMIRDGRLDILPDRLSFTTDADIVEFIDSLKQYAQRMMHYTLQHREVIRILMLESLKNSKHHDKLFLLLSFQQPTEKNPIYHTISQVDGDFEYSEELVLFKFFFALFPLVSFVAYYDDYKRTSGKSDEVLQSAFLSSYEIIFTSLISGKDILLHAKNE